MLRHILFKATVFTQATSYGATRNIFEETDRNSGAKTSKKEASSHAQKIWCFLKPKVLNDVRVIQIFEGLTLKLQGLYDCDLARVVLVTCCSRNLDLLYSDHFPCGGIQRQIDASKVTLPYELTPNPFEDGCEIVR